MGNKSMKRWDVINSLINKFNFTEYLEIGVHLGTCITKINVKNKDGVDPGYEKIIEELVNFKMESDDFFKKNTKMYDIVFIDGLHYKTQVDKDIFNSINHTKENGIILLHDCNPPTKKHAEVPRVQGKWNGDVYKSVLEFQIKNTNHLYFTIDTDWGIGIIVKNIKPKIKHNSNFYQKGIDDWDFFNLERKKLLNLISINDFKLMIKNGFQ